MSNNAKPPALLLIGHGSRDADGVREFHRMAERLFAALPERLCLSSFLELTEPSLREGVAQLSRQGATAITALPVMLMAAGHIKNDIPAELETIQAEHPEVSITLGTELGVHPALLQAARERIEAGETAFGPEYSRRDTLLLVVGRGSSDPDANSNLAQITRLLWETLSFGWAETAYCAVIPPSVTAALEQVHNLNFKYRLVFPYVLFGGRVIQQIATAVEGYRRLYPKIQVAMTPYLNDHPLVVQVLLERLRRAEAGEGVMNCPLCQYKEPIIGYEHHHGMPRAGQHHSNV
ncbi:MAG: sirohydrochlorin chelatase [Candidatus Competibacteraceae bacterium]